MITDLPPLLVTGRTKRVRQMSRRAGVDALVVTSPMNVRWLTGFTGSNGIVVISPDHEVLITDSRYQIQAPDQLAAAGSEATVAISAALVTEGVGILGDYQSVGLESNHITWSAAQEWQKAVPGIVVAVADMITELRSVKDPAELARMAAAADVVDAALAEVADQIVPAATENQIAVALDDGIRARGARGPAYETIVASGPNAALPHAQPSSRPFEHGDLVVVDVGAEVEGYRSDMTRTFVVGDASDRTREIVTLVTDAQAAGVAAVRAGIEAGRIDDRCRSVITEAGFGAAFSHGTGHGVGLDIHELPAVRQGNTAILQPGHVITVEPGVYIPGFGGARVEDTVVVTPAGCRSLTRSPKIIP